MSDQERNGGARPGPEDDDRGRDDGGLDDDRGRRIQDEAARLGLAIVGQATAMTTGDPEAVVASEENLHELVDDMVDQPLTEQQEEIVAVLGAMSGSLGAGLAGALADEQDREPAEILSDAASSILRQQGIAGGDRTEDGRP